jgi:RimJ/RimL family protein N-acetyltransferase
MVSVCRNAFSSSPKAKETNRGIFERNPMKYILETERLRLREFNLADKLFILELVNSPGWVKFIGDRNIKTEEQAGMYLENGPIGSYKKYGFGLSLVELKEFQRPIGMCGLLKRADLDHPDIGFAFLPEFTGKGYAYEMAAATLSHAKNVLNHELILAITVPENKSSIKLLEKINMTFCKPVIFPNQTTELLLYSNEIPGDKKNR